MKVNFIAQSNTDDHGECLIRGVKFWQILEDMTTAAAEHE
jgi:hypothetical protein